jgi:hypothetical protein
MTVFFGKLIRAFARRLAAALFVVLSLVSCQDTEPPAAAPSGALEIQAVDCHGQSLPQYRLVLQRVTQELPPVLEAGAADQVISTERAAEAATEVTGRYTFSALAPGYYNVLLTTPLPNSTAASDCGGGSVFLVRVALDSVSVVSIRQVGAAVSGATGRVQWEPEYRAKKTSE